MFQNIFFKLALIPVTIIIIVVITLLLQPGVESAREEQKGYLPKYVDVLTAEHKTALNQLALNLKEHGPIEELNTGDLSELIDKDAMIKQQNITMKLKQAMGAVGEDLQDSRRFIWLSDMDGDFIAGTPARNFAAMNEIYDRYEKLIQRDAFYNGRNDFLAKLIDISGRFDFPNITEDKYNDQTATWEVVPSDWRFFQYRKWDKMMADYRFLFMYPVEDTNGKVVATLSLRLDDSPNRYVMYYDAGLDLYEDYTDILLGFVIFSFLFLWFLIPAWVYVDAAKRGVARPFLWALITLISIVFGLTLYLIIRPKKPQLNNCPECDATLHDPGHYCPYCGFELTSMVCPSCRSAVEEDWTFCPSCRAELKLEETVSGSEKEETGV